MSSTEHPRQSPGRQQLADQFKLLLRGVAATTMIVTTGEARDWRGMVATAVMPVAMDPPSLIVAVNQSASSHEMVVRTGRLCINVLPAELAGFSRDFSLRPKHGRFDADVWRCASTLNPDFAEVPHLLIAQSVILCSVFRRFDVGTHSLFLSDVCSVSVMGPHRPLIYVDGDYGCVARSEVLQA